MLTFRQCPRKWWGQSISKLLPWTPSKEKTRGTAMHERIEDALRDINAFKHVRADMQIDAEYTEQRVQSVHRNLGPGGYTLYIEHEMAMSKDGKPVGWWDDKCFLRARADAILMPPKEYPTYPLYVIDIKTGKDYGDTMQLRTEALLAHILYGRQCVRWEYWYVDQGHSTTDLIDFKYGLDKVRDIYDTIKEMSLSIKNNDYPCVKNKFCHWCGFNKTDNCDVR